MEIKVRDMTEVEAKSKQEIEQELLKKHEEQQQNTETTEVILLIKLLWLRRAMLQTLAI